MTDPIQDRFASLVRRAAPAERDPLFRLRVLERREKERFRQRSLAMLGLFVALIAAAVAILALRPVKLDAAGLVLFGGFLASTALLYAPALLRQLRLSRL